MRITNKMRMNEVVRRAKITRLYRGYGSKRKFKTCAWRIVIECKGDWDKPRQAIDSAIRADKKRGGRAMR